MALYKKKILQIIKNLSNDTKQFKSELKNYPYAHSFNSLDEYFIVNTEWCKTSYISFKLKLYCTSKRMYVMFWLVLPDL
jgi:hypothetical protein